MIGKCISFSVTLLFSLMLSQAGTVIAKTVTEFKNQSNDVLVEYRKRQIDLSAPAILDWLIAGNRRFADGKSSHGGYLSDARERISVAGKGQRPLAAILSCMDSRTSPELVFDTSVGDLFTVRVGANVTNDDIIGSLEIAVESGAKVIVVLGHTDCGGIKAACSGVVLGHMTQLLERVKPSILITNSRLDLDQDLSKAVGDRVPSNRRYIAEIGFDHSLLSAQQILQQSEIIAKKVKSKEVLLISALFDVETGLVSHVIPK